jgi:TFIIH basal transcription factor complex TTD-A subunit
MDLNIAMPPLTSRWTGVLIECDPSVKAIILKYDEERHDYIVEDLDDDRHLVIKESQLQNLKARLSKVRAIKGPNFPGVLGYLYTHRGGGLGR